VVNLYNNKLVNLSVNHGDTHPRTGLLSVVPQHAVAAWAAFDAETGRRPVQRQRTEMNSTEQIGEQAQEGTSSGKVGKKRAGRQAGNKQQASGKRVAGKRGTNSGHSAGQKYDTED
jgi:hypothetical protein